jgi:lysosomal acid lipase/cholesteryl ester hydrolase
MVKNILVLSDFVYHSVSSLCKYMPILCKPITQYFIEDFPTERIDYNRLFEHFPYTPGGTSARNVNHWIQFFTTKEFTQYDFGTEMNYIKYGRPTPPTYDLTKFSNYRIPSLMTTSDADPFSKIDDCIHLFQYIDPNYLTIKELTNYNHLDYLWSHDAKADIYDDILEFLDR